MAKKEKTPSIKMTTAISLAVPNDLYFKIKTKADTETFKTGTKKRIHDQMIEDLKKVNP